VQVATCDMIGCKKYVSGSIQLGPGTLLDLCEEHLKEVHVELGRDEDARRHK